MHQPCSRNAVTSDSATIERATPDDVAAIGDFDVLLTGRDRQREIVRESVAAGTCLVARAGGALAGFVTWDRGFFGRPFVRLLVVARAQRRRGLGRALIAATECEAARYGELFVSTEHSNTPMQTLLAALDYIPSGSIDNINAPGNLELVYYKRLDGASAQASE